MDLVYSKYEKKIQVKNDFSKIFVNKFHRYPEIDIYIEYS